LRATRPVTPTAAGVGPLSVTNVSGLMRHVLGTGGGRIPAPRRVPTDEWREGSRTAARARG